jgi:hypothetical protein
MDSNEKATNHKTHLKRGLTELVLNSSTREEWAKIKALLWLVCISEVLFFAGILERIFYF